MGDDNLFKAIKLNEREAQKKWIHQYGIDIARFAFQYGVTLKDASSLATATFQQLFKDLSTIDSEDDLWHKMYEIVIRKLQNHALTTVNEFTFPEDEQLHREMIRLPHIEKAAFIFTTFSKVDEVQTAKLLNIPIEEVRHKVEEAYAQLSNNQIEKRLSLLQKSYNRMHFQIDEEQALSREYIKDDGFEEQPVMMQKRKVYMLVVGLIALIGILAFTVITNSEFYKTLSTEKWIAKMENTYDQKRARAFEEIGIAQEDGAFSNANFILGGQYLSDTEKVHFERFIRDLENDVAQGKPIDRKEMTERYDEFMDKLATPKEMAETLFKKPLTDDIEGSVAFLNQYLPNRYQLSAIYVEKVYEQMEIDPMMDDVDELITIEEVLNDPKLMTDDIRVIVDNMTNQQLLTQIDGSTEEQKTYFDKMRASLHPNMSGYISMIEMAPTTHWWYSWDGIRATSEQMGDMEATLHVDTAINDDILHTLAFQYANELTKLLKGVNDDIYDEAGFIEQDVRDRWRTFSGEEQHPVASFIAQNVLEDFEENDWRYSEKQILLEPNKIWNMIQHSKEGGIAAVSWEQPFEYNFKNINLLNRGFQNMVTEIYDAFQGEKDETVLNDVLPLTLMGLLVKASKAEDMAILQLLFANDQAKITEALNLFNGVELGEYDYIHIQPNDLDGGMSIDETDIQIRFMPAGDRWTIESFSYYQN